MSLRRIGWVWAFLLLPLITYLVAVVGPALYSFYFSLTEWNAVGDSSPFVGLRNYRDLAADPYFWNAFGKTALWSLVAVVVPPVVGLALALGLNRLNRMSKLVKSLFFLPIALSLVVVGQVWFWIFRPEDGLLNIVLRNVGLSSWEQAWLAEPSLAIWAVLVAWCWQQVALSMVIFHAGLTAVPEELIEASRMDGANGRQQLRHVVLPALRPAFVVVISLSMINALKSFDIIYVMTQGGPFRETETLAAFMYRVGFKTYNFGYASASAVVLFVITLVTIGLFFAWMNRKERQNG